MLRSTFSLIVIASSLVCLVGRFIQSFPASSVVGSLLLAADVSIQPG